VFTGLIEEVGVVARADSTARGLRIEIDAKIVVRELEIGDSEAAGHDPANYSARAVHRIFMEPSDAVGSRRSDNHEPHTMGGVHVSIQLSSLDSRVGLFRRACVQQRHHADDPIALNHWRWHYD
jgi:hypothetical protein